MRGGALVACVLLAACVLSLAMCVVTAPVVQYKRLAGLRGGGCGVSKPADPVEGTQGKPPDAQAQAAEATETSVEASELSAPTARPQTPPSSKTTRGSSPSSLR